MGGSSRPHFQLTNENLRIAAPFVRNEVKDSSNNKH